MNPKRVTKKSRLGYNHGFYKMKLTKKKEYNFYGCRKAHPLGLIKQFGITEIVLVKFITLIILHKELDI